MVFNKKAITPVVATALLLVVAVVAVVGFQTWFNTYQSGLNSKVEQQSATGSAITVERLENLTVYLKNAALTTVTSTRLTVDGVVCTNPVNITSGVGNYSLGACNLTGKAVGTQHDVVVVTNGGVYSAKPLLR